MMMMMMMMIIIIIENHLIEHDWLAAGQSIVNF